MVLESPTWALDSLLELPILGFLEFESARLLTIRVVPGSSEQGRFSSWAG